MIRTCSIVLPRTEKSVSRGRKQVITALHSAGIVLGPSSVQRFATVASELITNAVRYAKGDYLQVILRLDRIHDRVMIDVHDGSANLPQPRTAGADDESGRGMFLVEAWSLSWGAEHTETGKRVWAVLALPVQPINRRQLLLGRRAAAYRASRVHVHPMGPARPARPGRPGHTRPMLDSATQAA